MTRTRGAAAERARLVRIRERRVRVEHQVQREAGGDDVQTGTSPTTAAVDVTGIWTAPNFTGTCAASSLAGDGCNAAMFSMALTS